MKLPTQPVKIQVFRDDFRSSSQKTVLDLPSMPEIRRILIIKWGGMGDVVISTAIMEDIRRAFPQAEIDLNALPPWHRLFEHDPRFSEVWSVDLKGDDRGWRGIWKWLQRVKAGRYDLVIDLQTNDRSRWMLSLLWLVGAQIRHRLGNHPVFPYNIRQRQMPDGSHGFVIMRSTLAAAGIPATTCHPVLYPSQAQDTHARELLAQHGLQPGRFAIFLPGSHAAGLTKRWGCENYTRLAELLVQSGLQRIALIGGKDELEDCQRIATAGGSNIVNLCGQTALLELPAIYKAAAFIVGNDTGTAHLAAVSGHPMLILCGPTDPRRVKPIGAQVLALQPDLECKNCYLKTCGHHSCMKILTPEIVRDHLKNWL